MKKNLLIPLLGLAMVIASAPILKAQCQVGAFIYDPAQGAVGDTETGIQNYESIIGKPIASVMWFQSFREPFNAANANTV